MTGDANASADAPFVVRASAPVRTADVGGWTDTWFASTGLVCNVAIEHRARVTVRVDPTGGREVRLHLAITGEDYTFGADEPALRHPIIEGAIAALAPGGSVEVDIDDSIEPGSGLGTSATVMVAMVAALVCARGEAIDPASIASAAHRYETATGKQSGVQDHWAAAFGGVSLLHVDYPQVRRTAVAVASAVEHELGRALHTVWFGQPHASSALHDEVIARLELEGAPVALDRMRAAAAGAARALADGDLTRYGTALVENHEAIRLLHGDLLSNDADELSTMAAAFGARGWKVNGAGGSGGSMVVLGPADRAADEALREAIAARHGWRLIVAPIATRGVVAERFVADGGAPR